MIEITDSNFDGEVLSSDIPVFVDCFTEWCGPCKLLKPMLADLETANAGKMKLGLLNIETNPGLAAKLNVTAVPKVVVFYGGKRIESVIGIRSKADYQELIDSLEGENA